MNQSLQSTAESYAKSSQKLITIDLQKKIENLKRNGANSRRIEKLEEKLATISMKEIKIGCSCTGLENHNEKECPCCRGETETCDEATLRGGR